MAQVNICHFAKITRREGRDFALLVSEVVALEVHGLQKVDIKPGSVSVQTIMVDQEACLSGAATEIQVLISGNNWPKNSHNQPANALQAKTHFDAMAQRIHNALSQQIHRKLYVWITPFTASGWADGEYS